MIEITLVKINIACSSTLKQSRGSNQYYHRVFRYDLVYTRDLRLYLGLHRLPTIERVIADLQRRRHAEAPRSKLNGWLRAACVVTWDGERNVEIAYGRTEMKAISRRMSFSVGHASSALNPSARRRGGRDFDLSEDW